MGVGLFSLTVSFWPEIILLALASYRIARILIDDVIFDTPREAIWRRYPPESSKFGYLFTCYWCLGLWTSGILVVLYILLPIPVIIVSVILSLSTIIGFIHKLEDKLNG